MLVNRFKSSNKTSGFTLIEAIVVMVILAIAMVTLSSFLFPQVERSAIPHYQTRAVSLGQGLMNQILAARFDDNSDPNGGLVRCGENDSNGNNPIYCTDYQKLGAEATETDKHGALEPSKFNDVDDFIGCWYSDETKYECENSKPPHGSLASLLPGSSKEDYKNFKVVINVSYDNDMSGLADIYVPKGTVKPIMKRVELHITASKFVDMTLIGYKGNY